VDKLRSLQAFCPNLNAENHQVTSRATTAYNCVAWVLGDEKRWYEPTPSGQYFWPGIADSDYSAQSYINMFATTGFELCDTIDLEAGFEKIAIYTTKGEFTHVALQLPTGRWTSKLGGLEDIEHDTLKALEGTGYGKPAHFMKRRVAEPRLV